MAGMPVRRGVRRGWIGRLGAERESERVETRRGEIVAGLLLIARAAVRATGRAPPRTPAATEGDARGVGKLKQDGESRKDQKDENNRVTACARDEKNMKRGIRQEKITSGAVRCPRQLIRGQIKVK